MPTILDPDEPASGFGVSEHGGVAYALTGLLRALPWQTARGQLFVPLEILKKHGVDRAEFAAAQARPPRSAPRSPTCARSPSIISKPS